MLWALAGPLASQQAARDLQEASSQEDALAVLSKSREGLRQLGKLCAFVFEPAADAQVRISWAAVTRRIGIAGSTWVVIVCTVLHPR